MERRDVICAISTPPGVGAIGVVRLSGEGAADALARVFRPSGGKAMASHRLRYGHIVGPDGEVIDEVMAVVLLGPRSYTGEDTAEIYCHGGTATVSGVLAAVLQNGAGKAREQVRPAQPGEFTQRAFLNGRLDLTQAQAVMELIHAKTDLARRAGLRKLSGGLSRTLRGFRDEILLWLAHIELSVDYPEHEEEALNLSTIRAQGTGLLARMEKLAATAAYGRHLSAGVPTVILGRPNVGKSSLMNAILQEDRAIVTDIPGTTRDTLTEAVTLPGAAVPLLLTDTAGIRETDQAVEQMGVARSQEQARQAELALLVLDGAAPLQDEDFAAAALAVDVPCIVVLNKCDRPPAFERTALQKFPGLEDAPAVALSAKTGEGLEALYRLVGELFFSGAISAEEDIITQERHRLLLGQAIAHLQAAVQSTLPEDIVAIDLKAAYRVLGEILGEAVGDDVLERIFAEFCVGK